MNDIVPLAALLASFSLIALCALHVYWGVGGRWPGHDERSLVELVVGDSPAMRMPGLGPCLVVAALLFAAGLAPLAAQGWMPLPLGRIAALGAAGVLALRGLGGLFETRFRPQIVGRPYARLNLRLYSPLCLLLAVLLLVAGV